MGGYWDVFSGTVGNVFSGQFLSDYAYYFGSNASTMVEWIVEGLLNVLQFLIGKMAAALDLLIAAMPGDFTISPEVIASCVHYLKVMNGWVDVSMGLIGLGIWSTFMTVYVAIKFVRRLIPTAG